MADQPFFTPQGFQIPQDVQDFAQTPGGQFSLFQVATGSGFASSRSGGFLIDMYRAYKDDMDFQEFLDNVMEPVNAEFQEIADKLEPGYNLPLAINNLIATGRRAGEGFFDPEEAEARHDRAFGGITKGFAAIPGQAREVQAETRGILADTGTSLRRGISGIQAGFGSLAGQAGGQLARARDIVSTLGAQEFKDIDTSAEADRGARRIELQSRGLTGTTIRQSQDELVATRRGDLRGRLQDRIARQQLEVENVFGGRQLEIGAAGLQTRATLLGTATTFGTNRAILSQGAGQFSVTQELESLRSRADIAGGRLSAGDQARINFLENLMSFGKFGIDASLAMTDRRLAALDRRTYFPPTPSTPVEIQPSP